jgi:hypothetical protein
MKKKIDGFGTAEVFGKQYNSQMSQKQRVNKARFFCQYDYWHERKHLTGLQFHRLPDGFVGRNAVVHEQIVDAGYCLDKFEALPMRNEVFFENGFGSKLNRLIKERDEFLAKGIQASVQVINDEFELVVS